MTAPDAPKPDRSGALRHPGRQRWWWWALMGVIVVVAIGFAAGSPPKTGVSDERLFAIASRIKCLQCVGESVAASQASLAVQFRDEIRDRMQAGDSDDEILDFFAQRYGQEVLLTPPSSGIGGLVWVIPVVVVAAAVLLLAGTFARWRREREDRHATDADVALVESARSARQSGDEAEPGRA